LGEQPHPRQAEMSNVHKNKPRGHAQLSRETADDIFESSGADSFNEAKMRKKYLIKLNIVK
jgi:hypothetical protein